MDNKTKQELLGEIEQALGTVQLGNFGSVELIFQNNRVTQISVRSIKKTSIGVEQPQEEMQPKKKTFTIQAHFRRSE